MPNQIDASSNGRVSDVDQKKFDTPQAGPTGVHPREWRQLTDEEAAVIERGGTEAPFSGAYEEHTEQGTYVCKRCNAALFRSDDKFDARCGWPSFDDEVDGAITRVQDADGQRTEIRCSHCDAHLGHVFEGEGLTKKNTRHCVNSIALVFEEQ